MDETTKLLVSSLLSQLEQVSAPAADLRRALRLLLEAGEAMAPADQRELCKGQLAKVAQLRALIEDIGALSELVKKSAERIESFDTTF